MPGKKKNSLSAEKIKKMSGRTSGTIKKHEGGLVRKESPSWGKGGNSKEGNPERKEIARVMN